PYCAAHSPPPFSHRVAGADPSHCHRQPCSRRLGEMGGGGGDDADTGAAPAATIETEPGRQLSECSVSLIVEWMPVVGELDADPVAAEPVNQIGKRLLRRCRATGGKRLTGRA